jgi:hypothetical protein
MIWVWLAQSVKTGEFTAVNRGDPGSIPPGGKSGCCHRWPLSGI